MKIRKTPQEKKRLSLEKDRPSHHTKNDKGARAAIPKIKRQMNERVRRKSKAEIRSGEFRPPEEIEESLQKIHREKWWKRRPLSLGEAIKKNKDIRAEQHGARKRRRAYKAEYEKKLAEKVELVKRMEKYRAASDEKIRNVAFSLFMEEWRKRRRA